jgi:predicted ATPase
VYGQDPAASALAFEAWSLWLLGRQDSAAVAAERALAAAERSRHVFTIDGVLWQMAILYHELGDTEACRSLADRAVAIGTEQRFATQAAAGRIMRGAAQMRRGELADGLAQTREGVEAFRASGSVVTVPYQLSVLAGALLEAERADEGLAVIGEALHLARNNLDTYYEPELLRLRGELSSVRGDAAAAEASCSEALGRARERRARTLELRAATSLARLWSARGERESARQLLGGLHRSFDEGANRRDLKASAALLASLA